MEELPMPVKIARLLEDFINGLKNIYGGRLISVILYGSAASSEFSSRYSNVNLAVVLDETSLPALSSAAALLNKNKFRLLNVIFFTEEYIRNSADVFPVEFLDMKENHRILYGKDPLCSINIDIKNLRFQCEQELKSKIINIKRLYLERINSSCLDKLLMRFFTASIHILRNILRLRKGQAVYQKEAVLDGISSEFDIDISGMKKILDTKNANKRLPNKEARRLFDSFVADLEKISRVVDRL